VSCSSTIHHLLISLVSLFTHNQFLTYTCIVKSYINHHIQQLLLKWRVSNNNFPHSTRFIIILSTSSCYVHSSLPLGSVSSVSSRLSRSPPHHHYHHNRHPTLLLVINHHDDMGASVQSSFSLSSCIINHCDSFVLLI
jgi:hypothetical protein